MLNDWGPWYLLASGVVSLLLSTVLYEQNLRLTRRLMNAKWVARFVERPELPELHRRGWSWIRSSIDKPFMRRMSLARGIGMTIAGLAWMMYR